MKEQCAALDDMTLHGDVGAYTADWQALMSLDTGSE